MYALISKFLGKFISDNKLFKHGFNLSPMYRRSTGRIYEVSEDLLKVRVKIPLSYKNSNYVGSIFGGSLFSATDPIFMIQLINILDKSYVVWDKEATIKFKRPAKEHSFVDFIFSEEEIKTIELEVLEKKEIDLKKHIKITNIDGTIVFAEVEKTIYVADKKYYKEKLKNRKRN